MRGRSASSPYLFSGLLKCSECGANITIVSGRWRGRGDVVYGCPQNAYRGDTVCKNNLRVFHRPSRHAMRIWIDGVPPAFEDVFKMAAEEIRESEHPG